MIPKGRDFAEAQFTRDEGRFTSDELGGTIPKGWDFAEAQFYELRVANYEGRVVSEEVRGTSYE